MPDVKTDRKDPFKGQKYLLTTEAASYTHRSTGITVTRDRPIPTSDEGKVAVIKRKTGGIKVRTNPVFVQEETKRRVKNRNELMLQNLLAQLQGSPLAAAGVIPESVDDLDPELQERLLAEMEANASDVTSYLSEEGVDPESDDATAILMAGLEDLDPGDGADPAVDDLDPADLKAGQKAPASSAKPGKAAAPKKGTTTKK